MATIKQWVAGARPRTLPAALAPVIVGTAAAAANRDVEEGTKGANLGLALLALIVSCCLQVGVNYANDYSDGIRGTDEERVGPVRLVGQRLADPANVKLMAFTFFGIGAFVGFALVALSQARVPGASVTTMLATRPNQSKPMTAPETRMAVPRPHPPATWIHHVTTTPHWTMTSGTASSTACTRCSLTAAWTRPAST